MVWGPPRGQAVKPLPTHGALTNDPRLHCCVLYATRTTMPAVFQPQSRAAAKAKSGETSGREAAWQKVRLVPQALPCHLIRSGALTALTNIIKRRPDHLQSPPRFHSLRPFLPGEKENKPLLILWKLWIRLANELARVNPIVPNILNSADVAGSLTRSSVSTHCA